MLTGPFPHEGLVRGVSDGSLLLNADDTVRALTFARIVASGSATVRIPVDWRSLVRPEPQPGFLARDAASPMYSFGRLDGAVRGAVAAGLEPVLVVSHAPSFAEAPGRWGYAFPGSWAPSPAALGDFAAALASRYDGSFPDPLTPAVALPRVRLFQAWNEPNLARYLEPQWVAEGGHWNAFSPLLYRQMLNAFYDGVKSVQPSALVIAAGLAPNGDPPGVGRMAPITFLRSLLCLDAPGRPGTPACPEPSRFDVLAFHPLSVGSPDLAAASSLDLAISDTAKLTRLLARGERLGTVLPAVPKPIWVTELNWESAPQNPAGVPARLQAPWISRALHRLWIAGVSLVQWEFLIDPFPGVQARTPSGSTIEYPRPAGLYSAAPGGAPAGARPKAFLRGFTLPFDPLRVDRRRVRLWALLTGPGRPVEVQRRVRGGWRTLAQLRADSRGVLNKLITLRHRVRLRLRSGALTSAAATVPRVRFAAPARAGASPRLRTRARRLG